MADRTMWFKDDQKKWNQINNVEAWVIAFPNVARGWYRDKPPAVPGASVVAGGVSSTGVITLLSSPQVIIGGVAPVITEMQPTGSSDLVLIMSGDSSIAQDDDFLHTALRYIIGPEPIIFFKTSFAGAPALPDATTFSTERPVVPPSTGGHFPVIEGDCFFPYTTNCGLTNCPPQGWVIYTPSA